MSLYGANVEYGIHCLLHLVNQPEGSRPSARDVAEFQGVSPAFVAKIFTQLQKSGLVQSFEGKVGGFGLGRAASEITVLDVVDSLQENSPLFQCKEIRRNCVLHQGNPPRWATSGVCAVHAVMLRAESRMREELARTTLQDLADHVVRKMPAEFGRESAVWFDERTSGRRQARRDAN